MNAEMNAEGQKLMDTSRAWARAAASGDLDLLLSFWADDAMVLAPDQPPVVGKAAIREFVQGMLAMPGFSIVWEPEQVAIAAAGDMGYMVERNRATLPGPNGQLQTHYGKAVTIWRKNPGGEWKCVVDTWNGNPRETVL